MRACRYILGLALAVLFVSAASIVPFNPQIRTVTSSANLDPAWVTSNPSAATRDDVSGCVGSNFTMGASGKTVSALGMWVISGNTATITVYIKKTSDGTLMGSATFNTSTLSAGWNYVDVTPFALSASTQYSIHRTVTSGGGLDDWAGAEIPTVTAIATCDASTYNFDCTTYPPNNSESGKMFAGVNFKYH